MCRLSPNVATAFEAHSATAPVFQTIDTRSISVPKARPGCCPDAFGEDDDEEEPTQYPATPFGKLCELDADASWSSSPAGISDSNVSVFGSPTLGTTDVGFRSDLDREAQIKAVKHEREERHAAWVAKHDKAVASWSVSNWTKRQHALCLVFLVTEGHRHQKAKLEESSQASKKAQRTLGGENYPRASHPQGNPQVLRRLNLADMKIYRLLIHDVLALVDNRQEGVERKESVKKQLVSMNMWY